MEHIETIKIDSDEGRWMLVIETGDGSYRMDLHSAALDFAANIRASGLLAYEAEANHARATYRPAATRDDLDAYPLGSAKRISLEREMHGDRGI